MEIYHIKQIKSCWKGQTMEDIKINTEKLNKAIEKNNLPEVPRKVDGSIDLEAITIEIDEKENRIIPDEIFDCYYKELPNKVINQSRSWRTANGGKIKILGGNPEADKLIQDKGREANASTWVQRRSIKEILEELSKNTVTPEEAEEYGLKEGTTLLEAANLAQFRRAMRGDTKAAEYVRDTLGEKPADKISAEIETITPEDRKQIERILNRTKTQDIVEGE